MLERVTKAGEVFTVGDGTIEARINLATAAAGTSQTHAEKTLSVIEAALAGRLTSDIAEYSIAGRAVKKIPIDQLSKLRGQYAAMVHCERTGQFSTPVYAVFDNPETK